MTDNFTVLGQEIVLYAVDNLAGADTVEVVFVGCGDLVACGTCKLTVFLLIDALSCAAGNIWGVSGGELYALHL